jgi:hypothetical protein
MSDPVADLKRELVAAADRRNGHAADGSGRGPSRGSVRRRRLLLASGALSIAAMVALLFAAPWGSSPTFLERAEAALTPPPDTILHMKWEVTSSATDPACSATRGPNEIWVDQAAAHRYRAVLDDPPPAGADPRSLACANGTWREVGGIVDPACSSAEQANCTTQDTLEFDAPNTLTVAPLQFVLPPDPVTMLREAISAGNAHHEGKTQLRGRTVERIRIDLPSAPLFEPTVCAFPSCAVGHVYVDPATFHPIEMHGPTMYVMPPPDGGVLIPPSAITPLARIDVVDRYLTFEYLPRTEANLALTDIRAQHPNATVADD